MNILITGASRGIGRGLADHLAQCGHQVIGCSRSEPQGATAWRHMPADLCDEAQLQSLFCCLRRELGSLDALINNAGVARMAPCQLTPEEETRPVFELNLFSVFRCIREAVTLLDRSSHAAPSILNVTRVATLFSLEGHLAYAASKAAVEQSTRTLSREFAPMNIRVNALGLPPIRTTVAYGAPRDNPDAPVARQALRRVCEIDDVTGPVDFLLSVAARFVTGETLYLGGAR